MKIVFQQGKAAVLPAAKDAILERIRFALGRFSHRIRTLRIDFDDINGPRGGIDKRCTIEAVLDHRGPIVVAVMDGDVVVAGTRAARRIARRVSDQFERSRDIRRRDSGGIPMSLKNSEHRSSL